MSEQSMQAFKPSLSARRAWIEIAALAVSAARWRSLSARRAWIEIRNCKLPFPVSLVALRKESVDRNPYFLR